MCNRTLSPMGAGVVLCATGLSHPVSRRCTMRNRTLTHGRSTLCATGLSHPWERYLCATGLSHPWETGTTMRNRTLSPMGDRHQSTQKVYTPWETGTTLRRRCTYTGRHAGRCTLLHTQGGMLVGVPFLHTQGGIYPGKPHIPTQGGIYPGYSLFTHPGRHIMGFKPLFHTQGGIYTIKAPESLFVGGSHRSRAPEDPSECVKEAKRRLSGPFRVCKRG